MATHVARLVFLAPFMLPSSDYSVFMLEPRPWSYAVLVLWMALQDWMIRRHEKRGPMAILPKRWRPPVHSYNVPTAEVARLLQGVDDSSCAICRLDLLEDDASCPATPVQRTQADMPGGDHTAVAVDGGGDEDDTPLWRTPCNHLFHRECLMRWMDEKMICPLCRARLPKPW